MGEIDHADDAVDHGVADGDQAVDRAEDDAVDQLLGEIVHALPLVGSISGKLESGFAIKLMPTLTSRGYGPGSRNVAFVSFSNSGNPVRQQQRTRLERL